MKKRHVCPVIVILCLLLFEPNFGWADTRSGVGLISKERAIELARSEVLRRVPGLSSDQLEQGESGAPGIFIDGVWVVDVWRLPSMPGGFYIITIDPYGQILDFRGGL